ncbi:MAG: hypothetical protein AAB354_12260, partial [candidate division KSB1 bacterium]
MKLLALFLFSIVRAAYPQSLAPNEFIIKLSPTASLLKAGEHPRNAINGRMHAVLAQAGSYQIMRALPEQFPAAAGQFLLLRYEQPALPLAELIVRLQGFSEVEYAQFNHVFRCENIPSKNIPLLREASKSSQGHSHASELNCNPPLSTVILEGTSLVLDASPSAREGSSRMTSREESQTNAQRVYSNDAFVSANTPLAPLKGGIIPNDSLFAKQWALATLRATE